MKSTKYIAKQPDEKGFIHYTDAEHQTWQQLYTRQMGIVQNRACDAFFQGLQALELSADRIPQCTEITAKLQALSDFSVGPVEALISFTEFFFLS